MLYRLEARNIILAKNETIYDTLKDAKKAAVIVYFRHGVEVQIVQEKKVCGYSKKGWTHFND